MNEYEVGFKRHLGKMGCRGTPWFKKAFRSHDVQFVSLFLFFFKFDILLFFLFLFVILN